MGHQYRIRESVKILCCIMVLYNFDPDLREIIGSLESGSIDYAIFVDNSDEKETFDSLIKNVNIQTREKIIYIINKENIGLSKALNIGVKRAIELNATYIYILDQDAVLALNFFNSLYCKLQEIYSMDQRVGIIAPIVSNASPDEAVNLRFTSKYILAKNLINSGMLIPVYTFESIGYFDERLFLGGIDTEFVLRAKNNGFSVYRVNDILIHQNFGESIRGNSILIRTFTILSRIFSIVMLALGKTNQYRYYLVYYNKKQLQINQQDRNKLTEKDKLISLKNRFYDIIGVVIQIFIGDESNVKS